MNSSAQSDKERFERELSHYRSLAKTNKRELDGKPFVSVRLSFWMESVRFLITELEIWDYMRNAARYEETINKIHKAFHYIHRLVLYLDEENYDDADSDA